MAPECSCHHDSPSALEAPASPVGAEQTVADIVGTRTGALEILKDLGINHCCGAHLTLREAAAAAGVPLDTLLAALSEPPKTPA